jgi:hypothetical protein
VLIANYGWTPSPLLSGRSIGGVGEFGFADVALFPSAALLAAHRAFIAAASCARRSGERFNFFLGFLALLGLFPADAVARAADFLAAFNAFAVSACCSLRFSLASFSESSLRHFSSCWILFFNFFGFMIVLLLPSVGDSTIAF